MNAISAACLDNLVLFLACLFLLGISAQAKHWLMISSSQASKVRPDDFPRLALMPITLNRQFQSLHRQ